MPEAVRQEVRVRCPVGHAFAVFTERVDAWWPPSHRRLENSTLQLVPLGADGVLVEVGSGKTLPIGRVVTWEAPERLVLDWYLGAPAGLCSRVTLTFEDDGDSTVVRVVHVDGEPGLPDFGTTAVLFTRAWAHVLEAYARAAGETP